jgi:hypothetical protein
MPDRQKGIASPMRKTSWVRDGGAIARTMAFARSTSLLIPCNAPPLLILRSAAIIVKLPDWPQ